MCTAAIQLDVAQQSNRNNLYTCPTVIIIFFQNTTTFNKTVTLFTFQILGGPTPIYMYIIRFYDDRVLPIYCYCYSFICRFLVKRILVKASRSSNNNRATKYAVPVGYVNGLLYPYINYMLVLSTRADTIRVRFSIPSDNQTEIHYHGISLDQSFLIVYPKKQLKGSVKLACAYLCKKITLKENQKTGIFTSRLFLHLLKVDSLLLG